ncbi:Sedoheptulose-1,7-bisphosphatase [Sesbania bispinosa]|nr:Sedoheptulose-1,7-bisphosphatase [Sesbania bispinosa]
METGIASYTCGAFLHPSVFSKYSPPIMFTSFGFRGLKSSSLFGESLRLDLASKSTLKVSKIKEAPFITKCEIGDSLEEFLTKATPDKGLIRLMALNYSHFCKYACSEEVPELQDMGGPVEGGFSVAFDPLDGSSIVDTNFTVGTIFGVWPGDKLTGVTGRDQVAAAMGVLGPRTTYVLALKDFPGTHEFLLLDEGKWQHVKETTQIGDGKLFSPGNLRATFDNPSYDKLINYYVNEKYTLRYTGGMVPDVNQVHLKGTTWYVSRDGALESIIVKEKGIFTNVASPSAKAKLRLLFEVAPLGFLIEKAGGFSSDGHQSVLDMIISSLDDRTQVAYGSKNEIIRFEETLYGSSRLKGSVPVGATA